MVADTQEKKSNLHDEARLEEIARLDIASDEVDEILNDIAAEAAEEFDLPIGLVSIVLDQAQVFAGSHGLEGWIKESNGTPVEWSFCANSVESGNPLIVEDAEKNEMVKDNPLVTNDGIKCYAGVPLITSNGHNLGNFCVIGSEDRSFDEQEIERLKEYAAKAVERIEKRAKE